MRTLKSLEIKFHREKLAVSKKNICPCLSLSERSLQPLLFSSFNSFFPSAALSPMQCSHALQTLEGVCCQVWVPRVHISGFPSSAKDSGFFAFPTAAAGAQCGAFLGLGLCPGAVGSPGSQLWSSWARPARPWRVSEPAPAMDTAALPALHKALQALGTGFEELPSAFQRQSQSCLLSSRCWAALPASPGASLLPCQGQPRWVSLEERFVILVVQSILNLLRGRSFLLVGLRQTG